MYFIAQTRLIGYFIFGSPSLSPSLSPSIGVGYGMVVTSGIVAVYYNVIITYCIFYMFKSMTKSLPWVGCDHEWNSEYCSEIYDDCIKEGGIITNDNLCQQVANMTMEEKADYNITEDGSLENYVDPFALSRSRPSEDFYRLVKSFLC